MEGNESGVLLRTFIPFKMRVSLFVSLFLSFVRKEEEESGASFSGLSIGFSLFSVMIFTCLISIDFIVNFRERVLRLRENSDNFKIDNNFSERYAFKGILEKRLHDKAWKYEGCLSVYLPFDLINTNHLQFDK